MGSKKQIFMTDYLEKIPELENIEVPIQDQYERKLFTRGRINLYKGEALDKLATLTLRRPYIYHYEFGIAYPSKEKAYPMFLYQVIIIPRKALATVHYPCINIEAIKHLDEFQPLMKLDRQYSDLIIKKLKPQSFLIGKIVENEFSGLIQTTDITKAYERIEQFFKLWHKGLKKKSIVSEKEQQNYEKWAQKFKDDFCRQDYGFTATRKFLNKKWAKKVFNEYLFDQKSEEK